MNRLIIILFSLPLISCGSRGWEEDKTFILISLFIPILLIFILIVKFTSSDNNIEGDTLESKITKQKRDNIFFEETLESKITKYKNKKVLKNSNGKDFNLFKDGFWQGHKGLVLTFWGFFVGGNILFNAATMILEDNPTLLIFNLIFCVIWNVLSVIGVFNAADIYKAEKIKKGFPYTAATVAKVAVVLLILSAIGNNIPR